MPAPSGNLLIASLPASEGQLLTDRLEPAVLRSHDVLHDRDAGIEHVYFPDSGLVSLVSVLAGGRPVEMASVGREGMVGMPLFFGVRSLPERAVVQLPGRALRMSAFAFRQALEDCPVLSDALHRYAGCLYTMAAQNTACGRKHPIESRFARWLLHAADHSGSQSLRMTHEVGAVTLGVRRSSITVAAGALKKKSLISYSRSSIEILDRAGLQELACECYSTVAETYRRLVGA